MVRRLILAALALAPLSVAQAAELDGVVMPDTWSADGSEMRLNGIGLRTFSFLGIPIYVAGLYLERPSGRGLLLMRAFTDEVRYNAAGNQVTLVKKATR